MAPNQHPDSPVNQLISQDHANVPFLRVNVQPGDRAPLHSLLSTHDFEAEALRTLPPKVWAFICSAATDQHTKKGNSSAYAAILLRPRILRNVSMIDTSTSFRGFRMRVPIFCSPAAMAGLVHPHGEKAIARACKALGIAQCISTSASFPLADIVASTQEVRTIRGPSKPHAFFFQLYVDRNRERTREVLHRAQQAGAKAIFLTVDAPVPGKREADERIAADTTVASPVSGARADNDAKGGALGRTMGSFIDDSLSWDDIPWVRSCVPGMPLVLKGIQTSQDAVLAAEAGVDAIFISNHGGRTLDTVSPTILILLELQRNNPEVFRQLDVLVDGGISRGTDIFKALCLGAKAVGIGRGSLYAINYGSEGLVRYVDILRDELETTMKLCGVTSVDQLHQGYLNTLAVEHLVPSRKAPSSPTSRL